MKKLLIAFLLITSTATALAQSGTNSPYSQFGYGVLADQSQSMNRGMNGLAYGFHEHNQVNVLNPASYSALDSLSFFFDAGISGQITNFKENGVKRNAKNANLEYIVGAFRIFRRTGVTFGLLPYSNVGYNYYNTDYVDGTKTTTYTNTYAGDGGLHRLFIGVGWAPIKQLAVGVNVSYMWGELNNSAINSYSDASVNSLAKLYMADLKGVYVDVGLQYTAKVSKKDWVTLGVTFSPKQKLNGSPECIVFSNNAQTQVADTTNYSIKKGMKLPLTIGAGLMWNHDNKLKIGFDGQYMKWEDIAFPQYTNVNNQAKYTLQDNYFSNRAKFTLGGEYCPGERSRNFFKRIHYRAGISYTTPYLKINGQDGPKEKAASIGFGIPIINGYNNRSMLHISGQWVQSTDAFIKENTFRINIGFTFNERWFAKFKVQ